MEKIIQINGNNTLRGEIKITGAKNSTVAILPAVILAKKKAILHNIPNIQDVKQLFEILEYLNVKISKIKNGSYEFDTSKMEYKDLDIEPVESFRASYYFMGTMLAKYGKAVIGMPGGCYLGPRPIDMHLKGFKDLGCDVELTQSEYILNGKNYQSKEIWLDFPSVGATINLLFSATTKDGITVIKNVAKEPEIVDICMFLNVLGFDVRGAGTNTISIKGREPKDEVEYTILPDRIEAGTYILLGAMIGENLKISNIIPRHLDSMLSKLHLLGITNYKIGKDFIIVSKTKINKEIKLSTQVYPGFPTDLQQPLTSFLSINSSKSKVEDTIYPERYRHVPELLRMGADIVVSHNSAKIRGVEKLSGANVHASDLRAGAALVLAGLSADGTTNISNIEHILRGYSDIIEKLKNVGADIKIIDKI